MVFKSFYTRIIFILATMSFTLFAALALINTIKFRNEFLKSLSQVEEPRMKKLFNQLDQKFDFRYSTEEVKAQLDSMFFEFNLDVFDSNGVWITGSRSYLKNVPVDKNPRSLYQKGRFASFEKIYYNPNKSSPFFAVKIMLRFVDSPIFNRVFFNFFISGVVAILVSAIVGWRLVYYLNKRLDRLKKGVSKVARGEFDIQLENEGKDEIAFLARNFNHMSGEIKKLIEQIEESNAARQRLIAHASHEIKSPLTSIKGFFDILEFMNVLQDEQQKNLLIFVKKDLNRVIKISNDMLLLARVRAPEYKTEIKPIDINEFLLEEHSHFSHKASAHRVTSLYECNFKDKIWLSTDPERLSQIMENLWSNALKYGDSNKPIKTELFWEKDRIGIHISNFLVHKIEATAEQLFEPFYRNPVTSDKESGSGLGLSIVKELTEKLGGYLDTQITDNKIEICIFFPGANFSAVQNNKKPSDIHKFRNKK